MSDNFPLRILAEILAAETLERKRKVLDDYYKDQAEVQRFIIAHDTTAMALWARKKAQFAQLPWYRRIGKHLWDMSGD